jgi:translocation and assembly module TamB
VLEVSADAAPPAAAAPLPFDQRPIEARLSWSGRLAPLMAALPFDKVVLDGDGAVTAGLTGSLAAPHLSGRIQVSGGRYENYTLGTLLTPLDIDVRLNDTAIVIERFEAGDGGDGRLAVTGSIDITDPKQPGVAITATARDATLVRRDEATVRLDADLAVASAADGYKLSGTITNRSTDISLAGRLPPSVAQIEVEDVGKAFARAAEAPAQPETPKAGPPVALDVVLDAPGRIFVRGRGMDSEWKAHFTVGGTAGAPRIDGAMSPVRGGFDLANRYFDLESGAIRLNPADGLTPTLDLTAVYATNDLTARINVSGPANRPEIALSSDPTLPEDEILAHILFGRSGAELSGAEALQVAQAARTLTSGDQGFLDNVRRTLGVDVLTFGGGDGSSTGTLKAGKYVTKDVFVGVQQGTGPGSSSTVVEWKVTPKVTLDATVGQSRESSVGIQRRWDY